LIQQALLLPRSTVSVSLDTSLDENISQRLYPNGYKKMKSQRFHFAISLDFILLGNLFSGEENILCLKKTSNIGYFGL